MLLPFSVHKQICQNNRTQQTGKSSYLPSTEQMTWTRPSASEERVTVHVPVCVCVRVCVHVPVCVCVRMMKRAKWGGDKAREREKEFGADAHVLFMRAQRI